MARQYSRLTKEILQPIVERCLNYTEVCRQLGKAPVGGNVTNIRYLCVKWGIATGHMTGQVHSKGIPSNKRKKHTERLVLGSSADRRSSPAVIKRCLLDVGVEYKCNVCGLVEWNGTELVLEIDHINSCYWDNRIDNIQFICPNCHAQETTKRRQKNLPG